MTQDEADTEIEKGESWTKRVYIRIYMYTRAGATTGITKDLEKGENLRIGVGARGREKET